MSDRQKWRRLFDNCMICGGQGTEVHEIERRSQAPKRWAVRCNYLLVCRECHMVRIPSMSHAEQLAHKLVFDPEHFDLEGWLRVKDEYLRAPDRVTLTDVSRYLMVK